MSEDFTVVAGSPLKGDFIGSYTGDRADEQTRVTGFNTIRMAPGSVIENVFLDSPGGTILLEPGAGHQIRKCKLNGVNIVGHNVGRIVLEDLYLVNCKDREAIWITDSREYNRLAHIELLYEGAATGGIGGDGIVLSHCDLVMMHDIFAIAFNSGIWMDSCLAGLSGVNTDFCVEGLHAQGSKLTISDAFIQSHYWGICLQDCTAALSGVQAKGNAYYAMETSGAGKLSVGGCWFAGNSKLRRMSTIGPLAQFETRV